jgi:hypothetical protein
MVATVAVSSVKEYIFQTRSSASSFRTHVYIYGTYVWHRWLSRNYLVHLRFSMGCCHFPSVTPLSPILLVRRQNIATSTVTQDCYCYPALLPLRMHGNEEVLYSAQPAVRILTSPYYLMA